MPSNRQRYKIQDLQIFAQAKGGKCLSSSYSDNKALYIWQCHVQHEPWPASWNNIKDGGHWCPECAGNKPISLKRAQILAEMRGGFCKSTEIKNSKEKLIWECKAGHTFPMRSNNVQQGQWCKHCEGLNSPTIDDIEELVEAKEGFLVSKNYVNSKTDLEIKCSNNHNFTKSWNELQQGVWCEICAGNQKKTVADMHALAATKGGKCLSKEYKSNKDKLLWQCARGHKFKKTPNSVQQGGWCERCASKTRERLVRTCFEQFLGEGFSAARPSWLVSPRGGRMELDGYNEKLQLAFEHQGVQHFKSSKFFQQSRSFSDQVRYDVRKRELCEKHGVLLLEYSYKINLHDLADRILDDLINKKFISSKRRSNFLKNLDLAEAYSSDELSRCKLKAQENGGICLSEDYIDSQTNLKFLCGNCQNKFELRPSNLHRGQWCSSCGGNKKKTLAEIREYAKKHHQGECLSTEYTNNRTKLLWRCAKKHRFEKSWSHVRRGQWCKVCKNNLAK